MQTPTIGQIICKVPRARYSLSRKALKTIIDSLCDSGEKLSIPPQEAHLHNSLAFIVPKWITF